MCHITCPRHLASVRASTSHKYTATNSNPACFTSSLHAIYSSLTILLPIASVLLLLLTHQGLDHPLQSFLLDSLTALHPTSGSLSELPSVEAHPELDQAPQSSNPRIIFRDGHRYVLDFADHTPH